MNERKWKSRSMHQVETHLAERLDQHEPGTIAWAKNHRRAYNGDRHFRRPLTDRQFTSEFTAAVVRHGLGRLPFGQGPSHRRWSRSGQRANGNQHRWSRLGRTGGGHIGGARFVYLSEGVVVASHGAARQMEDKINSRHAGR